MIRLVLLSAVSVWALGGVALAQQTGSISSEPGTTNETDQSEEDWRRSRRVDSGDPFDPDANTTDRGWGTNLPPMRPVDHLPEESRRHLSQQRARAIAEMDMNDPQPQQVAYEPSDAARSDPGLRQQEEAVWAEMVGDLNAAKAGGGQGQGDGDAAGAGDQGSGQGGGQGSSPAGTGSPNGTPGSGSVMAGGANQSAADILRQMRGGGGGETATPPPASQPVSAPSSPQSGGAGSRQAPPSAPTAGTGSVGEAAATGSQSQQDASGQGRADAPDPTGQDRVDEAGTADQAGSQGAQDDTPSAERTGRQTSAADMIGQAAGSAPEGGDTEASDPGGQETAAQPPESGSEAVDQPSAETTPASAQNAQEAPSASAPSQPSRPRGLWEMLVEMMSGDRSAQQQTAPASGTANQRSDEPLFEPGSSQAERARELREQVERQRAEQP